MSGEMTELIMLRRGVARAMRGEKELGATDHGTRLSPIALSRTAVPRWAANPFPSSNSKHGIRARRVLPSPSKVAGKSSFCRRRAARESARR